MSRLEAILRTGKLRSLCIEKVKTRGSPPKDVGGAVALVHVEVDDEDPRDGPLGEQHRAGHADIVQRAEAGALRAPRVVAAAGRVAGDAVLERQPRGKQRAGCRQLRAPRHALDHGKSDLALDRRAAPCSR